MMIKMMMMMVMLIMCLLTRCVLLCVHSLSTKAPSSLNLHNINGDSQSLMPQQNVASHATRSNEPGSTTTNNTNVTPSMIKTSKVPGSTTTNNTNVTPSVIKSDDDPDNNQCISYGIHHTNELLVTLY